MPFARQSGGTHPVLKIHEITHMPSAPKIEDDPGEPRLIHNTAGIGYMFIATY